jgi:hypothetical protein
MIAVSPRLEESIAVIGVAAALLEPDQKRQARPPPGPA